jgi:TonB family protein
MRAQQIALSASQQQQTVPAAAQQKPSAATPAPVQAPAPAATTPEPSPTAEPPATTAAQPDQPQPQPQAQAPPQIQAQAAVSTPPAPAPAPLAQGSAPSNPEIVTQVMPDLLPAAVRSIHGKLNVKVRVTVDAGGNVSNTEFESEGPSKYFSKAAMDAAQKWKFRPVPGTWILDFQFKQSGVEVTPTSASH